MGKLIRRMALVGTPNLGVSVLPSSDAFMKQPWTEAQVNAYLQTYQAYYNSLPPQERDKQIRQVRQLAEPPEKTLGQNLMDLGAAVANFLGTFANVANFAPTNYLNPSDGYSDLIEDLTKDDPNVYANIEFFVIIVNRFERVVDPVESVSFGVKVLNQTSYNIERPVSSAFLKSHLKSFGRMWAYGRMINCISNTAHATLTDDDYAMLSYLVFGEDESQGYDYWSSSHSILQSLLRQYSNSCHKYIPPPNNNAGYKGVKYQII